MARSPGRELALIALRQWRCTREFADGIIQRLLSASGEPPFERAFALELFYGVLRNLILLDFLIGNLRKGALDALSRDLIRLGLYQLLRLQTPSHAAVFQTVELAPRRLRALINGVLRTAVRRLDDLQREAATAPLHIRQSHPQWLVERWTERFGKDRTGDLCHWNNQPAQIYARINTFRTSCEDFVRQNPASDPVLAHPGFVECDVLPQSAITRGDCYVQDPSTALAINLLEAKPGELILDACAAPGGKTFQIAMTTGDEATITACDRDPGRIKLLRQNLRRLGLASSRVIQHDWLHESSEEKFGSERFDKILVDAPCTNTGVMRRRVDVRWRLTPDDFAQMPEQQFEITRAVLSLLRPGGLLVYSTCSIEREENEELVERLTREFPALKLERTQSTLPFEDHFDGAFAARLVSTV
ncbi:MAG: rRNA (cytosine967-C5)-methyltransferase [Verrucomicrobiota bacterium]